MLDKSFSVLLSESNRIEIDIFGLLFLQLFKHFIENLAEKVLMCSVHYYLRNI